MSLLFTDKSEQNTKNKKTKLFFIFYKDSLYIFSYYITLAKKEQKRAKKSRRLCLHFIKKRAEKEQTINCKDMYSFKSHKNHSIYSFYLNFK